jgi:hypothetical protein
MDREAIVQHIEKKNKNLLGIIREKIHSPRKEKGKLGNRSLFDFQ